ncbi:LysR family transcriptional regulator [Paenibacillus ottowii]|uniref:LysR family transcriptional regulator n=1 Tax=Paenibacillus ottowii TaxID=2315729 RepID=A0ABY3B6E6_9BACL|nr:LysR family transcriptional regulator [Paenibacillus ottowii]NEU25059.1 LysR family transcriptional regulator [Paenibacillus polymyxa]TQR98589.1 LysR family transcriptional regulator [Paenibacillus ottowii]
MNILKLRILVLIDKFHKATEVAETLQIKQPTVSFHMKSLEKEMGATLFSLQQGRIMLTEAGKKMLPYAKQILSLEQDARQAVDELTEQSQGQLHLGAESISGMYLLPAIVAEFAQQYPKCRIQLEIQSPDVIKQLLKEGDIDFAFLDDRESLLENTVAEPVASDQVGIIRAASAKTSKSLDINGTDTLDKHMWVKYSGASVVDSYSSLVSSHLEINSWEVVKQVVGGGEALAFFPACGIRSEDHTALSVEWLPYPEADSNKSHYQINMVYSQDMHMSKMQQAFLDFIRRGEMRIS